MISAMMQDNRKCMLKTNYFYILTMNTYIPRLQSFSVIRKGALFRYKINKTCTEFYVENYKMLMDEIKWGNPRWRIAEGHTNLELHDIRKILQSHAS
jgi:hypothetical protein